MSHRTTRSWRVVVVVALLVFMPLIGRSTAPMPPPYHQFAVTGLVHRTDGGSVENIPVVLTQLTAFESDGYRILRDYPGSGQEVALTHFGGEFHLRVKAGDQRPDTIAVAVVFPEGVIHFGDPILVDSLRFGTHTTSYAVSGNGYCASDDIVEYTEGYLYSIHEQSVTIP